MHVLVLGCGPAGLIAAHAATLAGHEVIIASKRRKSELYGAQYLHAPIPEMTDTDPVEVKYTLEGTPAEYRKKVYGPTSRVSVSPEVLDVDHSAWDIRHTYDNLWKRYGATVQDFSIDDSEELDEMLEALDPAVVFSTVPATLLCHKENHVFKAEKVWAIGDAPERGIFCPVSVPPNAIVCDGTSGHGWYRASNVFGYSTAEWPHYRKPPIEGLSELTKPLSTDCNCRPHIIRLGRYGKWTKGVLSHEAFGAVQEELQACDMRLF